MKLRDTNVQVYQKNFFRYAPSCILPSFSQNASRLLLPKRLWKCASTISFKKYKQKVVLLVIYLFFNLLVITIHLSQLSSCSIWYLTFSWVQFLSNKLEFSVLNKSEFFIFCNIKITTTSFFSYLPKRRATWNHLKPAETTWNYLKPPRNCLKPPKITWNQPYCSIFYLK